MAIGPIVTRGYNTSSGTVNLVVTRGYAAAAFVASITVILTDVNNAVIPNLTGLKWAWWDSPVVSSQVTPTATGTGATTNGSGLFSIGTLTGTALTSGQTGWIEITNSDGTVSQSPVGKVAAGPVTVN